MTVPVNSKIVARPGSSIVIVDVSDLLPVHATKRYERRSPSGISQILIHKSGADGRAGFQGVVDCARYVIESRGFPGFPYTLWLSRLPDTLDGRQVVYLCNRDDVRSWHTGGDINRTGVAIGVQGNFDGDGGAVLIEPTDAQQAALPELVDWLIERHSITVGRLTPDSDWGLSGHWEHGKLVCPGDWLQRWVRARRGENLPVATQPTPKERDPNTFTVRERQTALAQLGFDPGPVDGVWGLRSRAALDRFQRSRNIAADGWWGPVTASEILHAFRELQARDSG